MKAISQTKKIAIIPSELEGLFGNFNSDTVMSLVDKGLALTFKETFLHQIELQIEFLEVPKHFLAPLFIAFGRRVKDPNNPDAVLYNFRGSHYYFHEGRLINFANDGFFSNDPLLADFAVFYSKTEFHFNAACFEKQVKYKLSA